MSAATATIGQLLLIHWTVASRTAFTSTVMAPSTHRAASTVLTGGQSVVSKNKIRQFDIFSSAPGAELFYARVRQTGSVTVNQGVDDFAGGAES